MIIKSVRVQNFRSIKDDTLECDKLTALVGANGAGKSSFLKALDNFYSVKSDYTVEDFYNKEISQDIIITVTFTELTGDEKQKLHNYIDKGTLTIEKRIQWAEKGKISSSYYGNRLLNPEFGDIRKSFDKGDRLKTAKEIYAHLCSQPKYQSLQTATSKESIDTELKKWEASNIIQCQRFPDEGQFFGFKEVGTHNLEQYTKFILIPAVRDASEDATEGRGKGEVLSELIGLVVRKTLEQKEEVKEAKESIQQAYEKITNLSDELNDLSEALTKTLETYAPSARVKLSWQETEPIDAQDLLPKAGAKLVEDEYSSPVHQVGNGLQRAFVLTMLQQLAMTETGTSNESQGDVATIKSPNLILAIEEPELYQHPNRQRYLFQTLLKLADGGIHGIAEKVQVIYATHSPLFINIRRVEQIRVLRKISMGENNPKQTKTYSVPISEISKCSDKIYDKPVGTCTDDETKSRLEALMDSWMNEGFFADIVVLVEGDRDRAAIIGNATVLGYNFERLGISVIPCEGKLSISRPAIVFKEFKIPVYAIWDSDNPNNEGLRDNHCLQRLFRPNEIIENWPEKVSPQCACFKENMLNKIKHDLGEEYFDTKLSFYASQYSMEDKHALKNNNIMRMIFDTAKKDGKGCPMLNTIISSVVALKQ